MQPFKRLPWSHTENIKRWLKKPVSHFFFLLGFFNRINLSLSLSPFSMCFFYAFSMRQKCWA